MSIQTNLDLYAYKKAMLSVSPAEVVLFSKEMEKNINKKKSVKKMNKSSEKRSKKCSERSRSEENKVKKSSKKRIEKDSKRSNKVVKKVKKSKKEKPVTSSSSRKLKSSKKNKAKEFRQSSSSSTDLDDDNALMNLSVNVKSLSHYCKNPPKLFNEMLSILQPDEFLSLVPKVANNLTPDEVKDRLFGYLQGMSSVRISHVLEGKQMDCSSATDSSDNESGKVLKDKSKATVQANHVDSTTNNLCSVKTSPPQQPRILAASISAEALNETACDNKENSDQDEMRVSEEEVEVINESVEVANESVEIVDESVEEIVDDSVKLDDQQQHHCKDDEAVASFNYSKLERLEIQLRERAIKSLLERKHGLRKNNPSSL